jgi:hypothetical protein
MAQTKISSSKQLNIDASLDVKSNQIINVANATQSHHAVNKSQLDAATAGMAQGLLMPVQNITALEAVVVDGSHDKFMINVEDSGMFRYDHESTALEDGVYVVTPDTAGVGAGRWIKMSNQLQDHNSASGIQGGNATERYHLRQTEYETITRYATGLQDGILKAADFATFNGKQNALGFTPENVANKAVANGYASLNASSKVVQDPANATATPTAAKIPIADGNGTLNSWISGNMKGKDYINRETPTGTKNGSNKDFTLSGTPVSGSEMVFLNGILQEPGSGNDYVINTNTITFEVAPVSTDKIFATYWK